MGAQFTIPLIEVIPGQLIASALWNNEWNNLSTNFIPAGMDSYSDTDSQMQIQTNPFPGSVTSHATSLGGEIERIRYQISQILGATTPPFWYAAPPISLTVLSNVTLPLGAIFEYPSATPPSNNFLLANGQAIGRSAYSALFNFYNSLPTPLPFGAGDGSTTFNLPNYGNAVGIGASNTFPVGTTGGSTTHTISTSELPAAPVNITDPGHNHTQNAHTHTDSGHTHIEKGELDPQNSGINSIVITNTDGTGTSVNSIQSTASGSANIQNAAATNNSNITGISAVIAGGGQSFSMYPPFLAIYKMVRVL